MTRRFLSMAEMTEASGFSRLTLTRYIHEGKLHAIQNGHKGRWRAEESCFDSWMMGEPCAHKRKEAA